MAFAVKSAYNERVRKALACLTDPNHYRKATSTMAESIMHPVLIRAKIAQRIHSQEWLNEYACPKCGSVLVRTKYQASKQSVCRLCTGKHLQCRGRFNRSPLYRVWCSMLERCRNKKCKAYRYYGARGIEVCEEWQDAATFLAWAENNGWRRGLEIDRIDVNGDYCPENCRFVTHMENSQTRRHMKLRPDDVRAIRMLRWSGIPEKPVAKIFSVSVSTVSLIMRGQIWTNV